VVHPAARIMLCLHKDSSRQSQLTLLQRCMLLLQHVAAHKRNQHQANKIPKQNCYVKVQPITGHEGPGGEEV